MTPFAAARRVRVLNFHCQGLFASDSGIVVAAIDGFGAPESEKGPDGAKDHGTGHNERWVGGLMGLNVAHNHLGAQGIDAVTQALVRTASCTLRHLDLSHNGIGFAGAECVAWLLRQAKSLEELNLADNRIGDIGVKHIAAALPFAEGLKRLNLAKNHITDAALPCLVDATDCLEHRLNFMDLGTNLLTDASVEALSVRLLRGSRGGWPEILGLGGNTFSWPAVRRLDNALHDWDRGRGTHHRGSRTADGQGTSLPKGSRRNVVEIFVTVEHDAITLPSSEARPKWRDSSPPAGTFDQLRIGETAPSQVCALS